MLVSALGKLARIGHRVNLILVGDGPEMRSLRELAEREGVNVHFEGANYDEHRIAELVIASTVTVAPGKVGLTAMHSMAYGVPVISHSDADDQMPEWEAIKPGGTGGYFKSNDLDDLADSIRTWTRSPFPDPAVKQA